MSFQMCMVNTTQQSLNGYLQYSVETTKLLLCLMWSILFLFHQAYFYRKQSTFDSLKRWKEYLQRSHENICNFLDNLFTAIFLLFEYPRTLPLFINWWISGQLIRLDLDQYLENFWQDNYYPKQVKYVTERGAETITQLNSKDETFDFNKMDYSVSERFIQLLPSCTFYYFSKLSKQVYYQCLDMRGLEFDVMHCTCFPDLKTSISENWRLIATPYGLKQNERLHYYVVCRGSFVLPLIKPITDTFFINPLPSYKHVVFIIGIRFIDYYKCMLTWMIHDSVTSIKVYIHNYSEEDYLRDLPLEDFMSFLQNCKKVTKIGVCLSNDFRVDRSTVLFAHAIEFSTVKKRLESWFKTRPDLKQFKLVYDGDGYILQDGKLKMIRTFNWKQWLLTDDCKVLHPPFKEFSASFFSNLSQLSRNCSFQI